MAADATTILNVTKTAGVTIEKALKSDMTVLTKQY